MDNKINNVCNGEEKLNVEVAKVRYVLNKDVETLSNQDNSWLLAYAENSDFYIPNALHVERNDEKMLVDNDVKASIEAEKAGIPLIYGTAFIPNRIYVDTEENRKILSEMLEAYPHYKKVGLLDEIFEFYGYRYEFDGEGCVKEYNDDGGYTLYLSIDEALKEWLGTMEETNESIFQTGDVTNEYNTWSQEEIQFIKNL